MFTEPPAVMFGMVGTFTVMVGHTTLIVTVVLAEAHPALSVAVTLKVKLPVEAKLPLNVPVVDNEIPAGRPVALKVKLPLPPVAPKLRLMLLPAVMPVSVGCVTVMVGHNVTGIITGVAAELHPNVSVAVTVKLISL